MRLLNTGRRDAVAALLASSRVHSSVSVFGLDRIAADHPLDGVWPGRCREGNGVPAVAARAR